MRKKETESPGQLIIARKRDAAFAIELPNDKDNSEIEWMISTPTSLLLLRANSIYAFDLADQVSRQEPRET